MFGTNIIMIQATSFINCQLNYFFGTRRKANLAQDDAVSMANDKFDGAANLLQFDAEVTQYFDSNTPTCTHKTKEEMFCTDIIVLDATRFFFSEAQNFACPHCKLIK